jgi:hypothetical protein
MGTNITGIGNANAIGFKSRVTGGAYFPPELKDALVGVWSAYGKSNDSTDRNIIKNKIKDRGGDFVISNAAYEGMSGYNGYPVVFGANKTWNQMPTGTFTWNIEDNKLHITKALIAGNGLLFSYVKLNGSLLNVKEIPSFKIKVSGLEGKSKLWYRYLKTEDAISETIAVLENGTHELPKSYIPSDSLHNGVWVGFTVTPISEGVKEFDCDITIEVLPEYEGAFVTDGVDDLITSTKTVQEMLGGSTECTVVTMMWNLTNGKYTYNNQIRPYENGFIRNRFTDKSGGKLSISGYRITNINYNSYITSPSVTEVKDILGDKNDFIKDTSAGKLDGKFSVEGYKFNDGTIGECCQVAWYWTIIANKVLTTDQINQVIAYFNLDRTLKPDILCNTIKQGITNENHAEFGDKLIDFSGNGRDIQLNNIAWKGDSGIGKYGMDFLEWKKNSGMNFTSTKLTSTKPNLSGGWLTFRNVSGLISETKVKVSGAPREFGFIGNNNGTDDKFSVTINNGVYTIPEFTLSSASGFYINNNSGDWSNLVIEQIPPHAGALCLDGINDFGKVTGMPVYKDYTVVTDREIFANIGAISSKNNPGAFVETAENSVYSFGQATSGLNFISTRSISYLSKHSYCGQSITAGAAEDGTDMWLGTIRDNDSRFFNGAIYSLMSFPYSMSEFLIERQLKKHKLGTLYPDMVEFRPIVKSNLPYSSISYSVNPGEYISVDSMVTITVTLPNTSDKLMEVSCNAISDISISGDNGVYEITGKIVKSPQKINLVISSYLTMLNNETLISNETLIKNE